VPDVVTTWFGVFLCENGRVLRAHPFPADKETLMDRLRTRRSGALTAEERALLEEARGGSLRSRDRRFAEMGVRYGPVSEPDLDARAFGFDPTWRHELALESAREALRAAWDPSVHIDEAIRAVSELDDVANRLGERLADWAARDAPSPTAEENGSGDALELARRLASAASSAPGEEVAPESVPAPDADLAEARRALARVLLDARETRESLERAIESALPRRAPNLTALLGPLLAARMISRAGGLDRLATLPASTVQVLGAERAFFAHLRGRAPPPRHGLLFLQPAVHSAPKSARGRLARALAGKVAIAARLDRAGAPLRPELKAEFEARIPAARRERKPRAARPGARPRRGAGRSRLPLDGAADDG
jgi:nucleolar protein 56